jgi:hypothetical protein
VASLFNFLSSFLPFFYSWRLNMRSNNHASLTMVLALMGAGRLANFLPTIRTSNKSKTKRDPGAPRMPAGTKLARQAAKGHVGIW